MVKPDTGPARKTAAFAISCGVAMRPMGLRAGVVLNKFGQALGQADLRGLQLNAACAAP